MGLSASASLAKNEAKGSKNMKRILIGILLLILFAPLVRADNDVTANTGNELIKYCNDTAFDSHGGDYFGCMMYVTGVYDGSFATAKSAYIKQVRNYTDANGQKYAEAVTGICIPTDALVTREQMGRVVNKYLKDHPEQLNMQSQVLVLDAFVSAWPCPKGSK